MGLIEEGLLDTLPINSLFKSDRIQLEDCVKNNYLGQELFRWGCGIDSFNSETYYEKTDYSHFFELYKEPFQIEISNQINENFLQVKENLYWNLYHSLGMDSNTKLLGFENCVFDLEENMYAEDLILLAGGFRIEADQNEIIVNRFEIKFDEHRLHKRRS